VTVLPCRIFQIIQPSIDGEKAALETGAVLSAEVIMLFLFPY